MKTSYLQTGYTESDNRTEERALRMFEDYKLNFQLTHTTEAEADALANMVDVANSELPFERHFTRVRNDALQGGVRYRIGSEGCGNDPDLVTELRNQGF